MKEYAPELIRNFALIGHGGSGKTSLSEIILYIAGETNRIGNVLEGNTVSDYTANEIEKADVNNLIHTTISKLPERYSAIITMFYLNEMSIDEISEVMSLSVSNVKVMLYRSRNSLRDLILNNRLSEELLWTR